MVKKNPLQAAHAFLSGKMEKFSWLWWPQTRKLMYSPGLRGIFRLADDEAAPTCDEDFFSRVHKDDFPGLQATARAVVDCHAEHGEEIIRIRRGDGSWGWALIRFFAVKKKDGKATELAGYMIDLSRLRVHSRFHLSTEGHNLSGYHAMLENSPDLTIRLNKNLSFIYVNQAVHRYLAPRDNAADVEEPFPAAFSEEHGAFIRRNARDVFSGGGVKRTEFTFISELRGEVSGEYTFWPELDPDGMVNSVIAQFKDNTEHIRVEQQARLNARRLAALYALNQMGDRPEEEVMDQLTEYIAELTGGGCGYIFFVHDAEGAAGRTFWSKALYDILGPEDLPTTRLPEEFLRLCKNERGVLYTKRILNGDGKHPVHSIVNGKYRVMRHMHVTVFDGANPVCVASVSNKPTPYEESDLIQLSLFIDSAVRVMNKHKHLRYLREAKETAERLNRTKDDFLANISHELRTPLNGILSMLQLLQLSPLPPEQLEYARTAVQSGEALLRIIADILDVSVMGSGRMTMHMVPYSLHDVLHSTINLFVGELAKKGLRLDLEISPNVPPLIQGDDARMRQIIFNVLGNAIKFTDKGEIRIYCAIVGSRPGKQRIHLAVSDTGIGIPEEQQTAIFDAFTQVDSFATRKYAGTGLGLNIVKRLVTAMGGEITLESELGQGATFHFSLPVTMAARTRVREEEKRAKAAPLRSLDVLVVEDDAVSRMALKLLLQRSGHRALCVKDGRQALEALLLHDFHCVFTDVQMPDIDGLELVRRIRAGRTDDIVPSGDVRKLLNETLPDAAGANGPHRELARDVLVAAVSAHAMSGDKEYFLNAGMDFYISKPVVLRELERVLARVAQQTASPAGAKG